jgi:two-component system NtrC family sensor kinase
LADQEELHRVFQVMQEEFGGFIDLGLIDASGRQITSAGPYDLLNKEYADQSWFHEVTVRGTYISDVFLGYRKFPHVVIAVKHRCRNQQECWVLRATIDTEVFEKLIAAMGLDPNGDAFLLNSKGVLQTPSKYYGRVLDPLPFAMTPPSYRPHVLEMTDSLGHEVLVGYTKLDGLPFILMAVKPQAAALKTWYTLRGEIILITLISFVVIILAVVHLTGKMIGRIEESENNRKTAYHQMEYTAKLASIGRLAAGVAHEINNPLAIINEKAGLMKDLLEFTPDFPQKSRFLPLTDSILGSVERCRTITHRLLGFARRMEVNIVDLNLNDVIQEVLGFLEKEAFHRNIDLDLILAPDLPPISSDHGQLQQVFLNIINNAFAAVNNGGLVRITSWEVDSDSVAVSIQDDGQGMSEEVRRHIFEPFYTTKKGTGTGLGLSITYGIVKKLDGDIEVKSKVGEGSTFTVYLPKQTGQQTE